MRQIVLDTETTGLKIEEGHRIIEIAAVEMVNRKLTGKRFHYYLNPEREIDEGALAVHGITNHFLQDKPYFQHIMQEFIAFIQGGELIIHNAPFDLGFLNSELQKANAQIKNISEICNIVDTLPLARQMHVGQRNSLDALCKRYNVDNSDREYHGALLDAKLLAHVYLAMTGGQSNLFEEELSSASLDEKRIFHSLKNKTYKLVVLKADDAEMIDHIAYLKSMSTKGKCIWQEQEGIIE